FVKWTPGGGFSAGVTGGQGSTAAGLGLKVDKDGNVSFGVATGGAKGGDVTTVDDAKNAVNNLGKGDNPSGKGGPPDLGFGKDNGPSDGGGNLQPDPGGPNDLGPSNNDFQPGNNSNGNDGPSNDPSSNPNNDQPDNRVADNGGS